MNKTMDQSLKKCPYCGEEIMATAKKCRHCGKWLTTEQEHAKTTHPDTEFQSQTNIVEKRQELPNAGMLQLACWITIVFEGISGMQNYPIELFSFLSPIFEFIADNIPEWLVTIALGALWVFLIMGLRTSCQIYNISKIPFIGLVCLMIGVYFMDLITCFVEDEDIVALLALFIIILPLVIALSILEFVTGIKLHHHKAMQHLGLCFMIYAIVPIITLIVELGLWGEETQFMVTFFIEYAITFAMLIEMGNVFGELK